MGRRRFSKELVPTQSVFSTHLVVSGLGEQSEREVKGLHSTPHLELHTMSESTRIITAHQYNQKSGRRFFSSVPNGVFNSSRATPSSRNSGDSTKRYSPTRCAMRTVKGICASMNTTQSHYSYIQVQGGPELGALREEYRCAELGAALERSQ